MKAMVLARPAPAGASPLSLLELPAPRPAAGEVLVRVRCCAVCRTDLHVVEGDLPESKLPLVPGHQAVGTVTELGTGCRTLREGERVGIAWLRAACGSCEFCRSGRENLCEKQRFTGYHEDGGYAQYAVVPEAYAYAIPETLTDLHAAPLLCSGIIGYRALRRANLPKGGRLALFGFGSSAHVVCQIARKRGCEIYVITRGESHRRLARELGAAWAGETIHAFKTKVDSAIVFAPAGEIVPQALSILKRGGTVSIAGIHLSNIPWMDYQKHLFYERDLRSVTANTRRDGRALLAEAAAIPVRPHVTTYRLEEANRALQDLKSDRIDGTAVLEMGG